VLFEHFSESSAWQLHEDTELVLDSLLNRGLILGLGTNYDSRIETVLAGMPALVPLKDRVVVSAAIGYRKPAAEFFVELVRSAGCAAQEVLFVGDDLENDYDGAFAAGLEAVLLDPQGRSTVSRRIERLSELM